MGNCPWAVVFRADRSSGITAGTRSEMVIFSDGAPPCDAGAAGLVGPGFCL
jgi:hypothetical protein